MKDWLERDEILSSDQSDEMRKARIYFYAKKVKLLEAKLKYNEYLEKLNNFDKLSQNEKKANKKVDREALEKEVDFWARKAMKHEERKNHINYSDKNVSILPDDDVLSDEDEETASEYASFCRNIVKRKIEEEGIERMRKRRKLNDVEDPIGSKISAVEQENNVKAIPEIDDNDDDC